MLPAYYLSQPAANWDAATLASFDQLYAEAVTPGSDGRAHLINYTLSAPKWQFLCYLCEHKDILLHGSGEPDIVEFEPRQSNDVDEFGNRRAVYASSDGIWPLYFAVVDRSREPVSLINASVRVVEGDDKTKHRTGPYYYFSVSSNVLSKKLWRSGTIYLLPKIGFQQQPFSHLRGFTIEIAQWANPSAVKPLARLAVTPEDFPFLNQTRPHDPDVIFERARIDPNGFPWLADDEV